VGRPKGSKNKHSRKVELVCPTCGKTFYRWPSKVKISKEKGHLMYCSRACSDANRKNVWSIYGPDHAAYTFGRGSYRQRALRKYGPICADCGWSGDERLLEVHHKDFRSRRDRGANKIGNLVVLCVRCHGIRDLEHDNAVQELEAVGLPMEVLPASGT
jgi:hypothetical protein